MRGTTIWLPRDVVEVVDQVKEGRRDPTRSDTVRYLILRALADMSFLPAETKKALGLDASRDASVKSHGCSQRDVEGMFVGPSENGPRGGTGE